MLYTLYEHLKLSFALRRDSAFSWPLSIAGFSNVASILNTYVTELLLKIMNTNYLMGRSLWPQGLRRWSSAACLLRLWFRIPPPGAWMFACCECCVLSGRGLCDGLITRPEESYRLWRVVVCDHETSKTRRLKPATGLWNTTTMGCNAKKTTTNNNNYLMGYLPNFQVFYQYFLGKLKLICGNKMQTRCNRGFYCRSYCLLNIFRAPLCPSSGCW